MSLSCGRGIGAGAWPLTVRCATPAIAAMALGSVGGTVVHLAGLVVILFA